jgi:hypothetical protein
VSKLKPVKLIFQVYIFGGAIAAPSERNNSYVEEFDTRRRTIQTVSEFLPVYGTGGLANSACLIAMPDEYAFAITGGIISNG